MKQASSKWLTLAGLAGLLGGNIALGFRQGRETTGLVRSYGFRKPKQNKAGHFPHKSGFGPRETARRRRQAGTEWIS